MPEKEFDYKEAGSKIFGAVKRPLVNIEIYSDSRKFWLFVPDVLADTGADVSILPRYIGKILVNDYSKGKKNEIRGIIPYAKLIVFIHNLKFRINGKAFELPVAIADSDDVPPILGRAKGLDIFECVFIVKQVNNLSIIHLLHI